MSVSTVNPLRFLDTIPAGLGGWQRFYADAVSRHPITEKKRPNARPIKVVRFLISSSVILGLVFISLFLADLAGFIAFPQGTKMSFSPLLSYYAPFEIPAFVLGLGFIRLGLFLAGALVLFWWLDLIEAGGFFVAESVRHIKWLGYLVISDWAVTKSLDAMAHSGVAISVGKLVLGLLIVLFAWVMDEGRKIQEEQQLTV